jgi:tetratricopeptide (TPR) repeat protein
MKSDREIKKQLIDYVQRKEFKNAQSLCNDVLKQNSHEHFALFVLGTIEVEEGRPGSAVPFFQQAIESDSSNSDYYANLGVAYKDLFRFDDAIRAQQLAIEKNPTNAQYHYNLSHTYVMAQRYEEAIKSSRYAIGLRPNDPRNALWLTTLGAQLSFMGDYQAAVEAFTQALSFPKPPLDALYQLGKTYELLRDWDKALRCFEVAARHVPKSDEYQFRRGLVCVEMGQYETALSALKVAQTLEPYRFVSKVSHLIANLELRTQLMAALPSKFRVDGEHEPTSHLITESESFAEGHDPWLSAAVQSIRHALENIPLGPLAIVFFHVNIRDERKKYAETVPELDDEENYGKTMKLSLRAARATNPHATLILITDSGTHTFQSLHFDAIIRLPINVDSLMLSRFRAYLALASSNLLPERVAFIDSDVCLSRDISPTFEDPFDVGLLQRKSSEFPATPIDPCMILGSTRRAQTLTRFFSKCVAIYEWLAEQPVIQDAHCFDIKFWRGNAYALAAFTNWCGFDSSNKHLQVGEITCSLLPASEYSPSVRQAEDIERSPDSWAFHFKGFGAKHLMRSYVSKLGKPDLR